MSRTWRATCAYLMLVGLLHVLLVIQTAPSVIRMERDSYPLFLATAQASFGAFAFLLAYWVVAKRSGVSKGAVGLLLVSVTVFDMLAGIYDGAGSISVWRAVYWVFNLLALFLVWAAPALEPTPVK